MKSKSVCSTIWHTYRHQHIGDMPSSSKLGKDDLTILNRNYGFGILSGHQLMSNVKSGSFTKPVENHHVKLPVIVSYKQLCSAFIL